MRFVTWGKFEMSPGCDLGQPWRMEELGGSLSWLVIALRRPGGQFSRHFEFLAQTWAQK